MIMKLPYQDDREVFDLKSSQMKQGFPFPCYAILLSTRTINMKLMQPKLDAIFHKAQESSESSVQTELKVCARKHKESAH